MKLAVAQLSKELPVNTVFKRAHHLCALNHMNAVDTDPMPHSYKIHF
jgi:hypothetical protein